MLYAHRRADVPPLLRALTSELMNSFALRVSIAKTHAFEGKSGNGMVVHSDSRLL
jgi:hypothetical protein